LEAPYIRALVKNSCATSTRNVPSFPPRTALGHSDNRILNGDRDRFKVQCLQEVLNTKSGIVASEKARGKSNLGIRVNNKTARCSCVESRDFWDIVVLPFTFLFLKLE